MRRLAVLALVLVATVASAGGFYGGAADGAVVPLDDGTAKDAPAMLTRPTKFDYEVALGLRTGDSLWNKFGYNEAVGTSAEVVASWGGSFTPMTTARTLSIVSTDATDDDGNTGANNVYVYGLDANRAAQIVAVTLDGTTPVVTTETWLGVNRMSVGLAGTGLGNAGVITATATTDATTQAQIPIGSGTSQQCIYHIEADHQGLAEWATANIIRFGSGTEPVVTLKGWVWSSVSNSKYEVFRMNVDTTLSNHTELAPPLPFPLDPASVFWLEATSTRADTEVSGRFSLVEIQQ